MLELIIITLLIAVIGGALIGFLFFPKEIGTGYSLFLGSVWGGFLWFWGGVIYVALHFIQKFW